MSLALVLPGIVAVIVAVGAGFISWSLAPRTAMRMLAGVATVTAGAVLLVVCAAAIGFAGRSGFGAALLAWCPALTPDHHIGTLEGLIAFGALATIAWRVRRVIADRRWATAGTDGQHMAILETEQPLAYAVPGKPGCVVVSRGLLQALDSDERRVVFAHERAHLAQHHHRYLLAGAIGHAIVPCMGRLLAQLRLATERCADEAAVSVLDGDRLKVASTIGSAALVTTAFSGGASAFGGSSIPKRVEALLAEPNRSSANGLLALAAIVGVTAILASSVQLHHVYELVIHICG